MKEGDKEIRQGIQDADDNMWLDLDSDNPEYFSKLYDKFSPALLGVIVKRVDDQPIAEIILENAFVKAWQRRKLFDKTKGRPFTWLYSITQTTCTDYLNSKQL